MMKLLKTLAATAALSFAFNAVAAGPQKDVRFVGDTQFAGFCKAIVLDDVKVLRSSLSRNVGRIGASQREVLRLVTSEDGFVSWCSDCCDSLFEPWRGALPCLRPSGW